MMSLGHPHSAASNLATAAGANFTATAHPAAVSDCDGFADQQKSGGHSGASPRRQFGSSHTGLSPDARELAVAIDQYKLAFSRRYLTSEEILTVISKLGYRRVDRP